ncbi:MAG: ATP-binding cassette domain-containing protein [Pseudoxanthomonas sp.]
MDRARAEENQSDLEPIIRVRGLDNSFGDQVVHKDLDLDVMPGEILGVVGGSGSGKSVLMRAILGLRRPQGGTIEVLGVDALSEKARASRRIERNSGVLYQNGALFSSLTVSENAMVPLKEYYPELPSELVHDLAMLKIRLSGLPDNAGAKFPSQLSGGMVKRAALARALALDPALLFLDEPTAGLDPISAAAFDKLILSLQQSLGLTVFLITHDLDTLYTICNRVAVIADNKVLVTAPLAEVEKFDHPWVQEYFHGPRGRAAQGAKSAIASSAAQEKR